MTREWKPGDVAMVSIVRRKGNDDPAEYLAFFAGKYGWYGVIDGDGCGGLTDNEENFSIHRRALVVIDPEDREQVARLMGIYAQTSHDGMADGMQAALREFANPTPPIDEPTNLYAVVRDRSDHEWCHIGGQVWRSLSSSGQFMVEKHWHDNGSPLAGNVVAILSEGVPA